MPGLTFVIDCDKAHESMGLPGVNQLDPPLMQGKTLMFKHVWVKSVFPGTNPEESGNNLYIWIDSVANQCLPPCAFVKTSNGEIQKGMYHQLKSSELERFIGELAIRFQDWEIQCIAHQKSCGSAIRLDGSGAGKVTMTPIVLGPFRGC